MSADDLLCAACGGRVGDARCPTCRASREYLREQEPQERRLAGARGAHEDDELALVDLDVDVVQGGPRARGVLLAHVLETDHGTRV